LFLSNPDNLKIQEWGEGSAMPALTKPAALTEAGSTKLPSTSDFATTAGGVATTPFGGWQRHDQAGAFVDRQ
jgi:hypothetical protein